MHKLMYLMTQFVDITRLRDMEGSEAIYAMVLETKDTKNGLIGVLESIQESIGGVDHFIEDADDALKMAAMLYLAAWLLVIHHEEVEDV